MKRGLIERNGKASVPQRRVPQARRTQTEEGQPPEAYRKVPPTESAESPANKLEKDSQTDKYGAKI